MHEQEYLSPEEIVEVKKQAALANKMARQIVVSKGVKIHPRIQNHLLTKEA